MNKYKTLLLSVVVAVTVISSITAFSFIGNDTTTPNTIINNNLEIQDTVSINENIKTGIVSDRELIPYSSLDNPVVSGEPSIPGYFEIKLSNLPLLNEVVNMTINVENISGYENNQVVFYLNDGWRFVNVPESEIEIFTNEFGTTYRIVENITVDLYEIQSFTKQVTPIELGDNLLEAFASGKADAIALQIGENRTITRDQYYEENPELAPWNIVKEPKVCVYEDCEPVPDLSRNSTGTGTTVPTPEQEEYIKEYWGNNNFTSTEPGASGAASNFLIHGFINNAHSGSV